MPPSTNRWPNFPMLIGSKKVVAAEVARQACHIAHSSHNNHSFSGFLYDRKIACSELLSRTTTTNLLRLECQLHLHKDAHTGRNEAPRFTRCVLVFQQHICRQFRKF